MAVNIDPSAVTGELTRWYVRLPLYQKVIFPLVVVGCVMGIVVVSRWASSPDYSVLYSDLTAADASIVIERLKDLKIDYQVKGDGSTIAISPPEMLSELRISLASEGIPKQGRMGWEIFDDNALGSTTFQEFVKRIRAKEGELERTIGAIEAIRSVRVGIAMPEKTVFAKKSSQPTASVLLSLQPGAELSKKQIKGIANLVAGAVEDLKPENVTIVDIYGNLLAPIEDDELGLEGEASRLQYRHEIEQAYVRRIEQMLSKVMGPDKVIARVTAELDFSLNEREEESFDPGGQVIRSERSIEEGSGVHKQGGIPGIVSNLAEENLLGSAGSDGADSNRRETVRNFEVSRAVTKVSAPRGKLVRLSVAVLVDGKYIAPEGGKATDAKVFEPLDSEVLSQIEALVKSAVGFDGARGDTLTVENIAFYIPEDRYGDVLAEVQVMERVKDVLQLLGPAVFIMLFFVWMVRPLVRFLITPTDAEVDLSRLLPTGINELEQEIEIERKRAEVPEYEPAVNLEQLNDLIAENSQIVKQNPEQAALLIRYWLNDGRI